MFLVLVVAFVASACEYTEILRISPDGTAALRIEIDAERGDMLPLGLAWTSLEDQAAGLTGIESADREEIRQFIVALFALEDTDPAAAEIAESLEMEMDGDRLRIGFDFLAFDLLSEERSEFGRVLFNGARAERSEDGSFSLSLDARSRATEFVSDLYALQGDPFVAALADNPDISPITMTAELQLPGVIAENDAHERVGNTLRWSWALGQEGGPGLSARWDPALDDDGAFFLRDDISLRMKVILVALFAIPFITLLVATFGFFEALRVRRRDRRDLG